MTWAISERRTASINNGEDGTRFRLIVERVRQVKVDVVRRTIVLLKHYCYHVPASIAYDRVGVTEAYEALFIHHPSPWLLDE